jgi:hypothetical protein
MNWKKISIFLTLILVGLITLAATKSTTYWSVWLKPHPRTIEPWKLRIDNGAGVSRFYIANDGRPTMQNSGITRWEVDDDGSMNIYNSAGTKTFGVDTNGSIEKLYKETPTALSWTSGIGWSITLSESASLYTINVTDVTDSNETLADLQAAGIAGVTLVLPTPGSADDGKVFTILKIDTGTTDAVLYAGGLPIGTSSGITDNQLNAEADTVRLMADYNSAVSYWILSKNIH